MTILLTGSLCLCLFSWLPSPSALVVMTQLTESCQSSNSTQGLFKVQKTHSIRASGELKTGLETFEAEYGEGGREREAVLRLVNIQISGDWCVSYMIQLITQQYNPSQSELSVLSIQHRRVTLRWEIIFGHCSVKETGLTTHRNISRYSHSPLDCYQIFLLFVIYFSIGQERQREFQ